MSIIFGDGEEFVPERYGYDIFTCGRFLLFKPKTEYRWVNGKLVDPPRFATITASRKTKSFFITEIDWALMETCFADEYAILTGQLSVARDAAPVKTAVSYDAIRAEVIPLNAAST